MKLRHQSFYISYLSILKHWPYTVPRPWLSKVANTFLQTQGSLLIQSLMPSALRVSTLSCVFLSTVWQ